MIIKQLREVSTGRDLMNEIINNIRPLTPEEISQFEETAQAGSATFVIKRNVYPEHFMGFNEYGYTSWTSYEPDGLRVPADKIATTMQRIQATAHSNAGKLSAHLLPNAEVIRSHGERDEVQERK